MGVLEFIEEQKGMLKDFSESQIRDNVYRYVFRKFIIDYTLETLIKNCMQIYSEILKD